MFPGEVRDETNLRATPALIRTWMRKSPEWLEVLLHQLFLLKIMLCRRLTQVKSGNCARCFHSGRPSTH